MPGPRKNPFVMGRTYAFECSRCGYTAKVSGGEDRGYNCFVHTITCSNCKQLYDAVIRARMADARSGPASSKPSFGSVKRKKEPPVISLGSSATPFFSPNRLLYPGRALTRWVDFHLRCPINPAHRIELWSAPGKCPRCGCHLDRSLLPYRVWD
jgi:hypothetical protein